MGKDWAGPQRGALTPARQRGHAEVQARTVNTRIGVLMKLISEARADSVSPNPRWVKELTDIGREDLLTDQVKERIREFLNK